MVQRELGRAVRDVLTHPIISVLSVTTSQSFRKSMAQNHERMAADAEALLDPKKTDNLLETAVSVTAVSHRHSARIYRHKPGSRP